MTRECCRTHSNSASGPLYQHRPLRHIAPDMDSAMGRNARYPKARALIRRHALRQKSDMIQRHNRELCGRPERPIRLRAITPHRPPHPFRRYAVAYLIHSPRAIAVRNDARIWHADTERVLTLFDIARVDAGGRDPNAYLARPRARVWHLAD